MGVARINDRVKKNNLVSVRGALVKLYDALWTPGSSLSVSTSPLAANAARPNTRYVESGAASITSYTTDAQYCKFMWEQYFAAADAPGVHASLVLNDTNVAMAHAVLPAAYSAFTFPHGSAVSYSTSSIDWLEFFNDVANPPNGDGTFTVTITSPPPLSPEEFPYASKIVVATGGAPGVATYYLHVEPLVFGSNTLIPALTDDADVQLLKLMNSSNFNVPLVIPAGFGLSHHLLLSGSDVGTQNWAQGLYFDSGNLITSEKSLELNSRLDATPSHPSGAAWEPGTGDIYISTCKSATQNAKIWKLDSADKSTLVAKTVPTYTDFRGPIIDPTNDRQWYIIDGADNATTKCALCEYLPGAETWGNPIAASTNPVTAYTAHDTAYVAANEQATLTNKFWAICGDHLFVTYGGTNYIEQWDVSPVGDPTFTASLDAGEPIYAIYGTNAIGLYVMTASKLYYMDPNNGDTILRDVSYLWPSTYSAATGSSTNHQDYVILGAAPIGLGTAIVFSLRGEKNVYTTTNLYYQVKTGVSIVAVPASSPEEYQIPECGSGGLGGWVDPLSLQSYDDAAPVDSSVDVATGLITLTGVAVGVITHDYNYGGGLVELERGPAIGGYRAASTAFGIVSATLSGDYQYAQGYEYLRSWSGSIFESWPTLDPTEVEARTIPTTVSGEFLVHGGAMGNLRATTQGTAFVADDYYPVFDTVTGIKTNISTSTMSYDFHTVPTTAETVNSNINVFTSKLLDIREHTYVTSGITFAGEARITGSYFEINGLARANAYIEGGTPILDTVTQFDIDSEIIIDLGALPDAYDIIGLDIASSHNGISFVIETSTDDITYNLAAGTMGIDKYLLDSTSTDRYVKIVFELISPIGETTLRINKITIANASWTYNLPCVDLGGFLMIDCGSGASEPIGDHSTEGAMIFAGDDIFIEPPVGSFCIDPIFGYVRMNDAQIAGTVDLDYYWLET